MPMNEEVRKAVETISFCVDRGKPVNWGDWSQMRTELTRLTEIADSVDPLVVRLGEVTTRLEAANALLVECRRLAAHYFAEALDEDLYDRIDTHLSEPRT